MCVWMGIWSKTLCTLGMCLIIEAHTQTLMYCFILVDVCTWILAFLIRLRCDKVFLKLASNIFAGWLCFEAMANFCLFLLHINQLIWSTNKPGNFWLNITMKRVCYLPSDIIYFAVGWHVGWRWAMQVLRLESYWLEALFLCSEPSTQLLAPSSHTESQVWRIHRFIVNSYDRNVQLRPWHRMSLLVSQVFLVCWFSVRESS